MKDYYQILGVDKKASKGEIVKSFRMLAKKFHPDLNKSADASNKFREVYEAYEILVDEQKRLKYDSIYNVTSGQYKSNYTYSNTQSTNSNNNDFSRWTQKAEENAKYYSGIKYVDFLKDILKGTARFFVLSGLYIVFYAIALVEIVSVLFIVFYMPIQSQDISNSIFTLNIIIGFSFGFFYYFFIFKSEEYGILNIITNGKKAFRKYIIYFVLLFYSIGICVVADVKREQRTIALQNKFSDLANHISEYVANFPHSNITRDIFNRGFIVIDMDKKSIDYKITMELPDSLRIYEHRNLNTIIQIWRLETKVGIYTDNSDGIQQSCIYKIIDFKTRQTIAQNEIKGSMPPSTITNHSRGYGSNPDPDLVRLIIRYVR